MADAFRMFVVTLLLGAAVTLADEGCAKPGPCKLEALGCFSDKFQRALPEEILNERDATSKVFHGVTIDWDNFEKYLQGFACRCAAIAAAKGYTVIGLQFYGECWSGPQAHLTYDKYGFSEECVDGNYRSYSKDKTCLQYVGRSWTNHVYRIGAPGCSNHNIEPIGCFHDNLVKPRPLPNLIISERDYTSRVWNRRLIDWGHWETYSAGLICRCAEAAKKRGDDYFAIQFWGECWSGKAAEVNYDRNGVSTECRNEEYDDCACNSYNCVGKAYTNYVYKFRQSATCSKAKK